MISGLWDTWDILGIPWDTWDTRTWDRNLLVPTGILEIPWDTWDTWDTGIPGIRTW